MRSRAAGLASLIALACVVPDRAVGAQGSFGPFDPRTGRFAQLFPNAPGRAPDTLAMPQPAAWAAVSRLYGQLGVPLSVVDTEAHVLGALRVTQRRPVGGERLSRILECGTGAYGPNAERYTVQLTLLTSVQPLPDGRSTVETRVAGIASPNGVSSSVSCASTGVLEDRIGTELRALATH